MAAPLPEKAWMPNFRRALRFLWPHRRTLIGGLIAAFGVSVFYTFGVSTVVPLLKVMFADHEELVDWLRRSEAERRLGVVIAADVPDDPAGLTLDRVRPEGPAAGVLQDGERIIRIDDAPRSAYAVTAHLAQTRAAEVSRVEVAARNGVVRTVSLRPRPYRAWWGLLQDTAARMPAGKSPAQRLLGLGLVMGAMVTVTVLGGVCRFINEGLVGIAVQRAMHDLRSGLAGHVLRLPLHWYSAHPPGDTLGRFATDISKVEVGVSTLFGKVVREPLKAIGVLVLTLLIEWRLVLVALVGLPIGAYAIRAFGRMVKRAQKSASQSWGRLLDQLAEKLAGIRVVKAYNMQTEESRRFEGEGRQLTRAQTHIELVDAATNPALETLAMIALAAFILYGGSRVFEQKLEPHLFFAAVICLGGVFDPVRKMGNVNNRLQQAEASARRLFELLDLPLEEPAEGPARPAPAPLKDSIEFRDVSFAYPLAPRRLVLDGVNLRVRKGQIVALVGPNGSGKTTLVSLLLRFYEPTRGQILIDGQDIAELPLAALRAQMGLVTQDAVIFSDTLRANIAYGANGVADADVRAAAQRARVEDFVDSLAGTDGASGARGYDVPINARTLSGGQRQRIALARAILREPPILILDEATSQIDSESERKIQQALEEVTRGRTTFIIAHRFSTIARADLTVVLNEGRVVAIGQHADLLERSPFYVNLVETQFAHGV